jgi:hypothetical protein
VAADDRGHREPLEEKGDPLLGRPLGEDVEVVPRRRVAVEDVADPLRRRQLVEELDLLLSSERAFSRNSGDARPSSSGCSSRSAFPRSHATRSPSPRRRESVSEGCSPPAQMSPPTRIVASSGTSASTASSAARFP